MAGNPSASWEEIVDRVSVKSNYFNVQDAANGWREIFQYLGELEGNLRKLKKNSESWTGGAADGFRARLDDYIKDIDTLQQSHERIVTGLEACAGHLKDAVDVIPIPSWMMTKLEDAQASYQMGDEVPGYAPGSFGHFYLKHVMGDAYSKIPLVGSAWKKLESWLIDNEKIAKQAYADLQSDYGGETSSIPTGQPISPQLSTDSPEFDPTDFNAGGLGGPGSGGMPSVDPSLDPGGLNAGGPGLDPGTVSMSDPAGDPLAFDPPGGTGLAGAGGGLAAPGGVGGLGAGGLSSPGGLGGGLSGPGGLGAGSGLGAAGPRGGGLGGMRRRPVRWAGSAAGPWRRRHTTARHTRQPRRHVRSRRREPGCGCGRPPARSWWRHRRRTEPGQLAPGGRGPVGYRRRCPPGVARRLAGTPSRGRTGCPCG
jgi:hypothetical protein